MRLESADRLDLFLLAIRPLVFSYLREHISNEFCTEFREIPKECLKRRESGVQLVTQCKDQFVVANFCNEITLCAWEHSGGDDVMHPPVIRNSRGLFEEIVQFYFSC